jgi:hypothetical protein
MLSVLIPVLLFWGPMLLGLGIVYAWRYQSKRRKRRTPVTTNLLRSPGDSLRIKIDAALFAFKSPLSLFGLVSFCPRRRLSPDSYPFLRRKMPDLT